MIRLYSSELQSMNTPLVHVLRLASLALLALPAQAVTVWTEAVNGDLSSNNASPTALSLSLGSNVINGNVNGGTDNRDYITFTIGPGQSLAAINLLSYDDLNTGAANDGNMGFTSINLGSTSFVPTPATSLNFLGGNHLASSQIGTDILAGMGAGIAGTGFTGVLGPGTYSYLVQQTGPELTGYSVELMIVPEPSALLLSIAGAGLVFGRRRRGL